MNAHEFRQFLKQVGTLTHRQRLMLTKALNEPAAVDAVRAVIERRGGPDKPPDPCPRCGHSHVQRWGMDKGLQRYRCKGCARTFNVLSGTPLARLRHRDRWLDYAQSLLAGLSVRKAARACGVHRTTSFRWRHRFLSQPRERKDNDFKGIVEADETYFLESFKGRRSLPRPARRRGGVAGSRGLSSEPIPVLIVRDRNGAITDAVLPNLSKAAIAPVLKPILSADTLLCTDGAAVYKALAKAQGIAHHPINLRAGMRVRQRAFHIQNVNAYGSRLKGWMHRFHGIATHYLPNYLGWRRMLEKGGESLTPSNCLALALP